MNEQTTFDLGLGTATAPVVPGLRYLPGFVDASQEAQLLGHVDLAEWSAQLSRRVQHYGWRYDYKRRRVIRDDYLGPLPGWLAEIANRVHRELGTPAVPDQVIVNEYQPGQGIAGHTDCQPCFGPVVAMLSLRSDIEMDFTGPSGEKVPQLLQRRSILSVSGPARTVWQHEIPKRRYDRRFGVTRERRVSLTFRTVADV